MILLLNGAFGIGKTTVARILVARLPRALLFDPELIGIVLQRLARLCGRRIDDFQDLALWRRLTVAGLRVARRLSPTVVVPMAFSNVAYLQEIRAGASSFESNVLHFCLVAPLEVVRERLERRGAEEAEAAWQYRRAVECCAVHAGEEFASHIAANGQPAEVAAEILMALQALSS